MSEVGKRNPACAIDRIGLKTTGMVRYNFGAAALYEEAIRRGEARLTAHGALVAETGQHTGRSPKDKFVVRDAEPRRTSGGTTTRRSRRPSSNAVRRFPRPRRGQGSLRSGSGRRRRRELKLPTRVVTEFAWHSLFIRNLLIRPDKAELDSSCRR